MSAARSVTAWSFVLLCTAAVSGCDPLGSMDFQGTYTLDTINGKRLPAAATGASAALAITAGSMLLNYDGTFVCVSTSDGANGQTTNREATGTFHVIPSNKPVGRFETAPPMKINLQWKGASTTIASLDGRLLTIDISGVLYVYRYTRPPPR